MRKKKSSRVSKNAIAALEFYYYFKQLVYLKFWKCLGWQPITCTVIPEYTYWFGALKVKLPTKPIDWMRTHKPDKDFLREDAETEAYGFTHKESNEPVDFEKRLVDSIISVLKESK